VSVINHPDSELTRWLGKPVEHCDWCGDPLNQTTVFWYLGDTHLTLHVSCAEDFGATLIFEARRARMIERGQNPLSGIVARSPRNGDPRVVELRRERGGG
jgi:hypothetical protein